MAGSSLRWQPCNPCCTSGTPGDCVAHPVIACASVTGCFTDLSGIVMQFVDSHGTTQTCTTNSAGQCCVTIVWSGTLTITVLSVPTRWLMPSPAFQTFTATCGFPVSATFPLTVNFPDYSCCCPDRATALVPMPATLTITTPLGNLSLPRQAGTGGHVYAACQTVPGVTIGVPTTNPLTTCAAGLGSTDVVWTANYNSGGNCFDLQVVAANCNSVCCSLPALVSGFCSPVPPFFGGFPPGTIDTFANCVASVTLTGSCFPVLATGTLIFDATDLGLGCPGSTGVGGSSLIGAIYGIPSWAATLSE